MDIITPPPLPRAIGPDSEVCQFKASQRLVYPNEASNNSEQPKKKAFSFESDAESENEFFDASDVIDTGEDTVVVEDTAVVEDTVVVEDTAVVEDTVVVEDTAVVEDTVVVEDTAVVEDTVVVEDTAVVEDTVVPISYSSPSRHKRKRINLNSSAESSNTGNNNDVNDIHDLDEPLPKRKRGKAPIYEFLQDAASLEELNALAKEAELTLKEDKGRSVLFKCKYPQCGYKWKEKKYLLDADPSKTQFSIIITCKSLMDNLRAQKHAQTDGTFKLITKNFVVILFGYSDVNRHFHCSGAAIVSSETTQVFTWIFEFMKQNRFYDDLWIPAEFLADNSKAISAALRLVFPTAYRKNCFAHVIMMADKKMKQYNLSDTEKAVVLKDIHQLSNICEEKMFDIAAADVAKKWMDEFQSDHALDFAVYFEQQYFVKDKFWFAQNGTAYRCNNGIEVTNKWIKVDFITQKAPLMRGITLLEKFLVRMRDKNFGSVEVRITDKDWVAAFDFKRVTSIFHDEDEHMYYLRRSNSELDDDQFQALVEMLDSDVFTSENVKEFQDNVVVIDESKVFDGVLTCSCPLGAQRKICKHVIVIEVKKKRRQFTSIEARRQQLTECGRNRAGRPKKHGPALSFK